MVVGRLGGDGKPAKDNGGGMNRNRRPQGTAQGGQFAPGTKGESSHSLDEDYETVSLEDVCLATREGLWTYVQHPDPTVRCATMHNKNISLAQLDFHQNPESPLIVRMWATYLFDEGRWRLAARDPSPLVRARAVDAYDIDPATKEVLLADPDVAAHHKVLATAAPRLAHGD